jgi:23S rRNA pseudouridine1911/1915/1917 synthase
MADRFTAERAGTLFDQLVQHFPGWSRNTLRQRLRLGCIDVNGAAALRHDQSLATGDVVEVHGTARARPTGGSGPALPVLFADDDLLAIDKPAGLLAVSSDDERERTALVLARSHVGGDDLWPVHRLDRETSGVLLFARSRTICDQVRAQWPLVQKVYRAVVEGRPEPPAGTIDRPLWEDRNLRVRAGEHADARPARTHYTTLQTHAGRSLLEVALDTGRKHQIRVHLLTIGHPVVGDDRYGTRAQRLCLHAFRLSLPHPRAGRRLELQADVPRAVLAELGRG